jgi:prevent-host-death family protein
MEKSISAADANRKFSELLRGVREGQTYVVTSHGKVVARIAPAKENRRIGARARSALLARLRSERVATIGTWTRDELYEDSQ